MSNAAVLLAAALGRGQDYDDPHQHPGHVSTQDVMPPDLAGTRFWRPDEQEGTLRDRHDDIRKQRRVVDEPPESR